MIKIYKLIKLLMITFKYLKMKGVVAVSELIEKISITKIP